MDGPNQHAAPARRPADWHVVTWVDGNGQTWRVERGADDGLWHLKRYLPVLGWRELGLYLTSDEAMTDAATTHNGASRKP
jgi:hypothetical protein